MIRKGLKLILQTNLGFKNVTEVSTCSALMNELKKGACTHLILDVILTDCTALEIVPNIISLYPKMEIMIFSMQISEVYGDVFKQYGIKFYLNKTLNEDDTLTYMRRFLHNLEPIEGEKRNPTKNPFALLSPRELEILHYLLNGHKTKDIAITLNLTMSTVSTIKKRIIDKIETDNMTQVLELATLYNINY
jgi:DNA-binding NarL/FixJ family response regulator